MRKCWNNKNKELISGDACLICSDDQDIDKLTLKIPAVIETGA